MKWEQVPLGPLQTNCYLVSDDKRNGLIIDPGEEGNKLIQLIEKRRIQPQAILLTHAHFDHIGAVDLVREKYQIPVYIHKKEANWLTDPSLNGSQSFMLPQPIKASPADVVIEKEGEMTIGSFVFTILETPGHSPGSVSYSFVSERILLSGDVLFQGSVGRTDLFGGNHAQLMKSIHDKLLVLPEDTLVLSGHGPVTSIEAEMDSNPFLNGF